MELTQLQNLCKRDPTSYKEEFLLQYKHFQTELQIFQLKPAKDSEVFRTLITFLSHVSMYYPKEMAEYPQLLMDLLDQNYSVLEPELRKTLVKGLILMRNKNFLSPTSLLRLFFKLFRCNDKALRKTLYSHIVTDIKGLNQMHKNNKLNRQLQTFMYTMLNDTSEIAAKQSLDVMIELYRTHVWEDAKTVNVISTACFSKCVKLKTTAFKFFLKTEPEEEEEEEILTPKEVTAMYQTRAAKTRKRKRKMSKALKKCKNQMNKEKEEVAPNFPALELINDPQGFTKKLFASLKHSSDRFEVKIMCANLVSRMISCHKLLLLNFYPFMQKYIQPHQQHLTLILAIVAQSCHDLIPPEALQPIVSTLANTFISEHCSEEVIAIGLNTVREICSRQPWVMNEELLQELLRHKKSHNKGIMMACRSLIGLYRTVNPHMLQKSERGKFTDMSIVPKEYGEHRPATSVEGAEFLEEVPSKEGEEEEEEDEQAWFVDDKAANKEAIPILSKEEEDESEAESEDEDFEEDANEGKNDAEATGNAEGEEREPKRRRVETVRLLTDEDFELIKKKKQELEEAKGITNAPDEISVVVDPTDIEGYHKVRKSKEERLEAIKQARLNKTKFGSNRKEKGGGTTNKEKQKHTPFVLAKQSAAVRQKQKMSLKQKMRKKKKKGQRRRNGQPR